MLQAVEQLGFGPVYHMKEVFDTGGKHIRYWNNVENGTLSLRYAP